MSSLFGIVWAKAYFFLTILIIIIKEEINTVLCRLHKVELQSILQQH